MAATLIEMVDFIASTISTKSSLSATSTYRGGRVGVGVLGGTGTGATHTDPTDILSIPIRPRPAMITDMATRLGVTTPAITAARTTEMTMKVLCGRYSPNTQFRGTAIAWPPSIVSSMKTVST